MIARKAAALASLVSLPLALAACDSKTEGQQQIEAQGEAIEESYDAEAEVVEALGEGAPDAVQNQAEANADVLRAQGDAEREHLDNLSDELDDVPNR